MSESTLPSVNTLVNLPILNMLYAFKPPGWRADLLDYAYASVARDSKWNLMLEPVKNRATLSKLVEDNQDLADLIEDCATKQDFERLFTHPKILPEPRVAPSSISTPSQRQKLTDQVIRSAWEGSYYGRYHHLLLDYINNERIHTTVPCSNQIAIIQSSGTGKSRMVHEQAQLVFTIPFNLRDRSETSQALAYPAPDDAVRDFLATADNASAINIKYMNFLLCVFTQVANELDECRAELTEKNITKTEDLAKWWSDHLNDARTRLYEAAVASAENSILAKLEYYPVRDLARTALERLIKILKEYDGSKPVKLVMYVDEAHTLISVRAPNAEVVAGSNSLYDLFCSCLNEFLHVPMFVIFLSTHFNLVGFLPAITETPFDCCEDLSVMPGSLSRTDISTILFMAQFGRPLFWTLMKASVDQSDLLYHEIKEIACAKLTGTIRIYDAYKSFTLAGKLAVLDVQLSLDYDSHHKEAQVQQATLVARHMRLAYSIPDHQYYMRSGYPSEPLLAEVAAEQLWRWRFEHPSCVIDMLSGAAFTHGLLERGDLGELTGRQLLLDAYHRAVESEQARPPGPDAHSPPNYSLGCKLITFFEMLFADDYVELVKRSEPDNMEGVPFEEAFKDAHVCFTHFGKMGDASGVTSAAAYMRHMAIMCQTGQGNVDCILPVQQWDKNLCEHIMTGVLIQFKRRKLGGMGAETSVDQGHVGFFPKNAALNECTHESFSFYRPYISLVMELGTQVEINSKKQPSKINKLKQQTVRRSRTPLNHPATPSEGHPCYSIFAYGCSPTVYRGIHSTKMDAYALLSNFRDFFAEHPRQDPETMQALRRIKPLWTRGEDCYYWIGRDDVLHGGDPDTPQEEFIVGAGAYEDD